ncbi:hypothetical protein DAI22_12g132750 [Oryza sativa Japonica Group]|nr:hypothetical protein DAI22_12g132750 [Oryza sativa Japonica Group]
MEISFSTSFLLPGLLYGVPSWCQLSSWPPTNCQNHFVSCGSLFRGCLFSAISVTLSG